jgi:hypothetical protein
MDWILLTEDRDRWWGLVTVDNEPPGSIICRKSLDWLRTEYLLKKDLLHGVSKYVSK